MSWIHRVPPNEATGLLKSQFDAAMKRAGRIWNVVHVQSLNPLVLDSGMRFYSSVMKGASPLTRTQREMLATVVSAELDCHY